MPSPGVVGIRSLVCPNCGAAVELRGMGTSLSAVCAHCTTILDTSTESLKVIQTFQSKLRVKPTIPLERAASGRGDPYEVTGFMVRSMKADGVTYMWQEYVLYNPYKGFRYLTEYAGHWNDVKVSAHCRSRRGRAAARNSCACWAGRIAISRPTTPRWSTCSASSRGA